MNFEHILGNDSVKNLLTNMITSNNILHSYMFVGEDGIGKFLFATTFSQMILCKKTEYITLPCHNCKSCIEFDTHNHPDFLEISSEDGKSIKIEQIRYLQEKISEKPIVSDRKVYIINDSHLMTKEAQNCLLKTLEEPPEYAVIILVVSNENKLLNTIKSRCTKINFQKLTQKEIIQFFNSSDPTFVPNDTILRVCDGSIGKALSLKKEITVYQDLDKILENFSNSDIIEIWNSSSILYKSKDIIQDLLEYMNVSFMNQLVKTNDIRYANCINITEKIKKRLLANANYDMSIDSLLLNIWEEINEKHSRY